jgi:hypothetical protein
MNFQNFSIPSNNEQFLSEPPNLVVEMLTGKASGLLARL